MPNCPQGATWVAQPKARGGGWCVTPDGKVFDAAGNPVGNLPQSPGTTAPSRTPAPITGAQPTFGAGGPMVPSMGGGRGYTSVPGSIPGGTMGGGTVGGSGFNWKGAAVSGGLGLMGQIFDYFAKKNQTNAQNQNNAAATAQARADAEQRARAGSVIYSNMLQKYGRGDLATPEDIYRVLMRPPSPTVKIAGPSIFSPASKAAEDASAGASDYFSMQGRNQAGLGSDPLQSQIMQAILELFLNRSGRTPTQGGTLTGDEDYWQD